MGAQGGVFRGLEHAALGNGRVLALVAPDTHVEWLCLPRFDSPSVFARLIDRSKGGSFGFSFDGVLSMQMAYVENTNVVRTRITTADGVCDLFDYAPRLRAGAGIDAPLELHRVLVPREGAPTFAIDFDPRPDYARSQPEITSVDDGIRVGGSSVPLYLRGSVPASSVTSRQHIRLDTPHYLVLSVGTPTLLDSFRAVDRVRQETIDAWRAWATTCAVPTFAGREVIRSALCLKLHVCEDTGAIIAAATTSIPEALGTERTWDYRYCWLRDAAFVVEALRRLSHLHEGERFVQYLRAVAESGPLQPVYGIGGERDLPEFRLEHLAGFGGNGPVRIGNAAYAQTQHDVMGEMLLCLETVLTDPRIVGPTLADYLPLVERLVGEAIAAAPTDDTGIWEFRTRLGPYTFSKVLCWVAAHRGATLARRAGREDLARDWDGWAAAARRWILDRGYNARLGYFTQTLDGVHPDASLLLLPTLGIIDPHDPRFVGTLRAYERLLVKDGLMLRYRNLDDLGETTTAFSICSFWWVEALAMVGDVDKAVAVFERLLAYANPVGLFSEDIDPATGALLGNFPQAYTHVGLIHAAITLGEVLETREGRFRAWT